MNRSVEVQVGDERLCLEEASILDCVRELDAQELYPIPAGSIVVAFVDEAECRRLHQQFFGDPDITDVMTFPGDPDDDHAGDIAICPQVAASACRQSGLPFREELTLYLVHAWLHLAGLDDKDDAGRAGMRTGESTLMEKLSSRNALLKASWSA